MAPLGFRSAAPGAGDLHERTNSCRIKTRPRRLQLLTRFTLFFETFSYMWAYVVTWWSVLLTGKYPQSVYDTQRRVLRHYAQYTGYILHITDQTPRFNSPEEATYPIQVTFPEQLPTVSSRFRPLYVGFLAIPAGFGYLCRFYASLAAAVIANAAILFTGRYPEGLFRFNVGTGRQYVRLTAFVLMMTEVKPPSWE
jgi:hypothetical protein